MKIVKLEDDRIKVVLSDSDLIKFDIDFESISPESPEMNSFLSKIIKAVSEETGVFIEEGQILIEAGKEEETIVIFITKAQRDFSLGKRRILKSVHKSDRLIFEIPVFDDIFMMLTSVNEKILKKMCIYRYKSGFYISVPRFPVPAVVWEFSKKCRKNRIAEALLSEHGKLIAKEEQVVKMAKEIKKII